MNSLITIGDLSESQLLSILQQAVAIKSQPWKFKSVLAGKHLAMLFEKPSLRTRASFSVGIEKMGGQVHFYDLQASKIGQRESASDLARNLSQWYQGIIARVDSHQTIKQLSAAADVPLINALCDRHHPCQALADALTLFEIEPDMRRWHIGYFGDGNNVARSLVEVAVKTGASISLVTPEAAQLEFDFLLTAQNISQGQVRWYSDPGALSNCDVLYTDVWSSMGQKEKSLEPYVPFQVNSQRMQQTGAQYFMHCQPVHRGEEVTSSVCDGAKSLMLQQAANRLFVQQAVLHSIFEENQHG